MLSDNIPYGFSVVHKSADFSFGQNQAESKIYVSIMMNTRAMLETVVNYYIQMK